MFAFLFRRLSLGAASLLLFAAIVEARQAQVSALPPLQQGQPAAITGQVRRAATMKPVVEATVLIEGTSLTTTTDKDGRFSIPSVPPRTHHVVIAATDLMPLRVDVTVGPAPPPPLDVIMEAQLHYTEVVSVGPTARDPFASYQPTTALSGQELTKALQGTLGSTLQEQPGVAARSFGPGPSRPVIRGLDGDRVLILKNGQRFGDLSSQSGDHGVPTNPASASQIEVVRGPATLLYGANAIGGLVNIIDDTIPIKPVNGLHGNLVVDGGSAATELGGAADVHWGNGKWAVNLGGSGRRSDDVEAPDGTVENTQSRGGFGSFGVAWTGARGFFGGSYGYDDTKYGLPFIEEGQVELTPRRHTLGAKAGVTQLKGLLEGIQVDFTSTRYKHEEIVAGEVGTRFENDTDELNLRLRQQTRGRFSGTIGGWVLRRDFNATGEEALSPPVKERGLAAFFYEEVAWSHATFQFGARLNHVSFDPDEDLPSREFTDGSGSIGLLLRPRAANDQLTLAISLARASRNPALEELYFFGPHPGNFAFEIGNPDLTTERAFGFDVALRWRKPRFSGEISYFRNSIDDYIFRNPISEEEFDAKYGHEADGGDDDHGEFPFIEFAAADSVLQGIEGHADITLGRGFDLELGLDYVRGELQDSNDPLPRIPPFRFRTGLTYHRNAFQAGGEVIATADQDRVFGEETPTPGYGNLRLFSSYSFGSGTTVHTLTARLDNATNELYRNHLSLIKDHVPEMGRNLKLLYSVKF